MRASVLILLVGCGARSELDAADVSAQPADASEIDVADTAVDVGDATNDAHDAAACLDLPDAACTNEPPYDSVLSAAVFQCLSSTSSWACGYVYVNFDVTGCALTFEYQAGDFPSAFRACFEATVASQRWPCEMAQTSSAYLGSCTVH